MVFPILLARVKILLCFSLMNTSVFAVSIIMLLIIVVFVSIEAYLPHVSRKVYCSPSASVGEHERVPMWFWSDRKHGVCCYHIHVANQCPLI